MPSSPVIRYLWPSECPRCQSRLSTLDRLALQSRRLGALVTLSQGKMPSEHRDLRRCEWCQNAPGSGKAV